MFFFKNLIPQFNYVCNIRIYIEFVSIFSKNGVKRWYFSYNKTIISNNDDLQINIYEYMSNNDVKLNTYSNLLYIVSPFEQEKYNLIKEISQAIHSF